MSPYNKDYTSMSTVFQACRIHHCPIVLRRRHLTRNNRALSSKSNIVKLGLSTNDHPPFPSKVEVRGGHADEYLAEQCAGGIPHVHAITYSRVHVAVGVAMNAIGDAW